LKNVRHYSREGKKELRESNNRQLLDSKTASVEALNPKAAIAIVGCGMMGVGIAQLAAVAGHRVVLYDIRADALAKGIDTLKKGVERLVEKGLISADAGDQTMSRVTTTQTLSALDDVGMVIEAVAEDLQVKQALFTELEAVVSRQCILASNTSSLSITSIASPLKFPDRVVGMHFFNPVHAMQLVEVVRGLATSDACAHVVYATAARWGKAPVYTKSTPGFIVNRVARPYYAEGLRLLNERAGTPASIDAVMREAGGFRMGPFELMDLIGHDTNLAVTKSMFHAYFCDPRFTPSVIQQELVDARYLGRKSGRGFYQYGEESTSSDAIVEPLRKCPENVSFVGEDPFLSALRSRCQKAIAAKSCEGVDPAVNAGAATLALTDGRTASQRAKDTGVANTVVIDLALDFSTTKTVAVARAAACRDDAFYDAVGLLQTAGYKVIRLRDLPALAVMRTLSMLVNEAADVVNQGVCSVSDLDAAMEKGVNYPRGPLAWADIVGIKRVQIVLKNISAFYGEDRYRISPLLNEMALGEKTFCEFETK
jgi:3-hydroxybutyryl-CoA dehydrogenase